MSEEKKAYELGGEAYELLPPLYGVMEHIVTFNTRIVSKVVDMSDLLKACSDDLPFFVAGLITPKGVHPKERNLAAMAVALRWEKSTLLDQVVADFFGQSDVSAEEFQATSSLIKQVMNMTQVDVPGSKLPGTSQQKSVSSQEGTSSDKIESVGKSALPKQGNT